VSRPKVAVESVMQFLRKVAQGRIDYRSNKEVSRDLAEQLGVHLTPQYVGKLVAGEARQLRQERNIHVRMFHDELPETDDPSRTIG
jgi:hypothetical protein